MPKNIDKYKADLHKLLHDGNLLSISINIRCFGDTFSNKLLKALGETKYKEIKKNLPNFNETYQTWYSEALSLIKQLLPDRLVDFTKMYEKPKNRKELTNENYVIEDYLQGLTVTRGSDWNKETVVDLSAAIPKYDQQLNILKAVEK